jgi:hypothetical protein
MAEFLQLSQEVTRIKDALKQQLVEALNSSRDEDKAKR